MTNLLKQKDNLKVWIYFYDIWLLPHPTQLNSELGKPYFPKKPQPQNHKPKPTPTFLCSYTTKLDQIQYSTLFQPN